MPRLGIEANLSEFRTFVRFTLVWFPLGVWEGLRLVIVALPGLFFSNFCFLKEYTTTFFKEVDYQLVIYNK